MQRVEVQQQVNQVKSKLMLQMRINHVRQREWIRKDKKRALHKIEKIIITGIITVTIIVLIIITKVTRIEIENVIAKETSKGIVKETGIEIDREIKKIGTLEKRIEIERAQGRAEAHLENGVSQTVIIAGI